MTEAEAALELQETTVPQKEYIYRELEPVRSEEVGTVASDVRVINIYLDKGLYYPIKIPANLEIVTDNSKYLYARDNSIHVSVVSNVNLLQFSEFVFIKDADTLKPNLIVSKIGADGPQEAAIHVVNDKAIIVRAYNNPTAYATVLHGLETNTFQTSNVSDIKIDKDKTKIVKELPTIEGYLYSVSPGMKDGVDHKIYMYDTGSLTVAKEFRTFQQAFENTGAKLAIIASKEYADVYYQDTECCYVEVGDYVMGLFSVNYNTTLTCFGYGGEAKSNVLHFLKAQKE